jgi:hypothetical protein
VQQRWPSAPQVVPPEEMHAPPEQVSPDAQITPLQHA